MTDKPAGPTPEFPVPEARVGTEDVSVVRLLLDMQQQIARVEGTQIAIVQQMQSAENSRREIYKKIDAVSDKTAAAAHRAEIAVTRAEHAVAQGAALKPSVDDFVTMRGYVRAGLWALGLVVMPLLGIIGYGAMQAWQYVVTHIDLPRLWK